MSTTIVIKKPILVETKDEKIIIEQPDQIFVYNDEGNITLSEYLSSPETLATLIDKKEVLLDYNEIIDCMSRNIKSTLIILKENTQNKYLIPDTFDDALFLRNTDIENLINQFKENFAYFDMILIKKKITFNNNIDKDIVSYKPTNLSSITIHMLKPQKKNNNNNNKNSDSTTENNIEKKGKCLKRKKNIINTK